MFFTGGGRLLTPLEGLEVLSLLLREVPLMWKVILILLLYLLSTVVVRLSISLFLGIGDAFMAHGETTTEERPVTTQITIPRILYNQAFAMRNELRTLPGKKDTGISEILVDLIRKGLEVSSEDRKGLKKSGKDRTADPSSRVSARW